MAPSTLSLRGAQVLQTQNLSSSGALLVPSRLSPADLPRLIKLCGERRPSLLVEPDSALTPEMQQAVQSAGVPLIPQGAAAETGDAVARALSGGGFVIVVPPAVTAIAAAPVELPRALLEALCALQVPLQPVGIDHPRASSLTIDDLGALPESILTVAPVIPVEAATPAALVQSLTEASAHSFSCRTTLNQHLGRLVVAGMKKHAAITITDGLDGCATNYARIFGAAAALASHIRKETTKERIGIVLPPGRAGLIANLAAVLAGKSPVNLNFTASKESVESAMRQSDFDRILTADTFVRKMQTFPWPPNRQLIFLERILPNLKGAIVRWVLALKFLPAGILCRLLKLPEHGGDREAALLFTSGSSGEPKGVMLSHRNLISNVTQFSARLGAERSGKVLGCLPLFHSFGGTVTVWFPVIEGCGLVTFPSPMEAPKLAELVEKHSVTLLLATPTFLRGYLRRVKREQLATLRLIVTGAEKLPLGVEEDFRKKFGKPVMEGYGLTETSPATNFNLPEPENAPWPVLPSRRLGSVGPLLPGVAIRITDPVNGGPLPVDQSGMIWLRGPNIFTGYLKQPRKTEEVLQDGWFRTGDIGRLDTDGFLHIEGRLSRFSKIAGEMVPHETIEDHINRALNLDGEADRRIAVVGVPDPDKGEALVLLSTIASEAVKQEIIQLRYTLLEHGVPALWIPKRMIRVDQIPLLASGKLDIRGCEKLAASAAG